MEHVWVGHAGTPLQVFWIIFGLLGIGACLWGGSANGSRVVFYMCVVMSLIVVACVPGLVLRYRPATLTLDDWGVHIRRGKRDRFIGYRDIDSVVDHPQSGPHDDAQIYVMPSAEFLARTGDRTKPGKPDTRWTLETNCFQAKQRDEFLPLIRERVAQAHGQAFPNS